MSFMKVIKTPLVLTLAGLMVLGPFVETFPSEALRFGKGSIINMADWSFEGEKVPDQVGTTVAILEDVNGDGYDDLLTSSSDNTNANGNKAGKVYLLFGSADGWPKDTNVSKANASFLGNGPNHGWSLAIASAGDVNGDGLGDFLIGDEQTSGSNGAAYLFFGKKTGWANNQSLSSADASWVTTDGSSVGRSVSSAGDVNGDGYDDILIGAPYYNILPDFFFGATYLFLGKASGWAKNVDISTAADGSFIGERGGECLGYTVSRAGDVNGDGLDDFLTAAPWGGNGGHDFGTVYLFLGRTGGWDKGANVSSANASFVGDQYLGMFGMYLAGGGDVNGDGLSDLLLAAPREFTGTENGEVYLILGRTIGFSMNATKATANASYVGLDHQHLGEALDLSGDFNGDGLDDILIGAQYTGPANLTGRTYVFFGKRSGWTLGNSITTSPNSLIGNPNSGLGAAVSAAGDVNGDGIDDIALGAPLFSKGAGNLGKVFVVFPSLNLEPSALLSIKAYSDEGFSKLTLLAPMNTRTYIELRGTDADPTLANIARVRVDSSTDFSPITVSLRETGASSGVFRGNFTVRDRSDQSHWYIGAEEDCTINVTHIYFPGSKLTLYVTSPVIIGPAKDIVYATEDELYSVQYSNLGMGTPVLWNITTNATWLNWSAANLTLYGVPDNSDVGTFYVNLSANVLPITVQRSFNITVNNSPPKILTSLLPQPVQGQKYSLDLAADDEGQGSTSWALQTNASWLHLNTTSGLMNGTPLMYDVFTFFCNVTFDDGNGGLATSRYVSSVKNANDKPMITSTDVTTATQDMLYSVVYSFTDPDVHDSQAWTLTTDASWLHFGPTNLTLWGVPRNSDVGNYSVNVTVLDTFAASDTHLFIITVLNVNDPPRFSPVGDLELSVLDLLELSFAATDIDKEDALNYSLVDFPANMNIEPSTGALTWLPTKDQRGSNKIVVSVFDGTATVLGSFWVLVSVPRPALEAPANKTILKSTTVDLQWKMDLTSALPISYDVVLDEKEAPTTTRASDVKGTTSTLTLKDLRTYHWYVVPRALGPGNVTVRGDPSAVWSLTIDLPKPAFDIFLELTQPYAVQGKTLQVWVTITNRGNVDGSLELRVVSDLPSSSIDLQANVTVLIGRSERVSMNISVPSATKLGAHNITIKALMGNSSFSGSTGLTVKASSKASLLSGMVLLLLVLLVVVIAVLIAGVAYMSRKRRRAEAERHAADKERLKAQSELAIVKDTAETIEDFNIDEIFLIYKDGRLITHVSYKHASMDEHIFSSMLVAVQAFVADSFKTDDSLSSFEFGSRKMVMEKGHSLILAVALSGKEPSVLKENMRILVQKVEGLYAGIVENWDGDNDQFKDANLLLSPLFDIKRGLKIKKEKEEVTVKSGIEFFGGYVRLKVAIANGLSIPAQNVRLEILYDKMTLLLSHIDPAYPMDAETVSMGVIPPEEKRTVAFYLDPLICQESNVEAKVTFEDAHGNLGEVRMKKRPVDIVCPLFYTPTTINTAMLNRYMTEVQYKDMRLYALPEWADPRLTFLTAKEAASLHNIRLVREFESEAPYMGEAWFYGKVQNSDEEMILKIAVREDPRLLEVLVATNNLASQAGLLAEVSNNIGRMCQERKVCTLVPCTDQNWKDYVLKCSSLLDRYIQKPAQDENEGQPAKK